MLVEGRPIFFMGRSQAKGDTNRANWVCVELRQDRVYQTFTRIAFEGVQNLCVIGNVELSYSHICDDLAVMFIWRWSIVLATATASNAMRSLMTRLLMSIR